MTTDLQQIRTHRDNGTITDLEYVTLTLRYERKLTHRQIALALGVSRATVRERLWNAHRKIGLAAKETA